jgi:hypothetical protein
MALRWRTHAERPTPHTPEENPMDHLLHVTLDKSSSPWLVDIDQQGNPNHIDRSPQLQTIAWELVGDATAGKLSLLVWLDPAPPDGIFGPPELAGDGRRMTLTDRNDNPDTSGSWNYQLSLSLGGQTYSTRAILPTGTTTNPSIKNN